MTRWLAAIALALFLIARGLPVLAGDESGDPHGHGDVNGDLHSGH